MNNISINQGADNCCGCAACADICPQKAITMAADENGFTVPVINEELCIECSLCRKVCQYVTPVELSEPLEVYAAVCNDNSALMRSASGGCFYSIADSFLESGGAVAGCAYEESGDGLTVRHIIVSNSSELERLQGSKYVQSDTAGIFIRIKELAETGRPVLFSGTPCQVAACRLALGKKYENVYYIDIVCHGVPSFSMFKGYITYLEKKYGIKIDKYVFRDKSRGWGLRGSLQYRKGNKPYCRSFKTGGSSYYALFLQAQTYRDSCYQCRYAGKDRCGDITLGDYWGIEKVHPEYLKINGGNLDEKQGVSCLLVNSRSGKDLMEKYCGNIKMYQSEFSKAAMHNAQLREPSKEGNRRKDVLRIFAGQGYEGLEKWFYRELGIKGIVYKLYDLLPPEKI